MPGKPRKRKHKQPRTKTTGRVGTILLRKEKKKKRLEESKWIMGVFKPKWRNKKKKQ